MRRYMCCTAYATGAMLRIPIKNVQLWRYMSDDATAWHNVSYFNIGTLHYHLRKI